MNELRVGVRKPVIFFFFFKFECTLHGALPSYLPDKNTDIVLGATIARDWVDAASHCYLIVDLDEP